MLMLSAMGRADGGRETWAYSFLPRLLAAEPDLRLRLHALRWGDQPDHGEALREAMGACADRFTWVLHEGKRGRWPLFFSMVSALRRWFRAHHAPDYAIGGSFMEYLMMLAVPQLRHRPKIVWLRTILMNEKAYRFPAPVLALLRRAEGRLLRGATLLFCNGDDIRDYYAGYGLDAHVIRNGVDAEKWAMPPPRLERPIRVAYIGRTTTLKGFEAFIETALTISAGSRAAEFEFHCIGGLGETAYQPADYEHAVMSHGLVANARLPAMLREVDVCVALTRSASMEGGGGTSNAMMEQMAAGRVMLAWDNRIFRQYLHADNAWLAPQDDVPALVAALFDIADRPDEARLRARRAVETVMPWSNERLVDDYRRIVAAAGL